MPVKLKVAIPVVMVDIITSGSVILYFCTLLRNLYRTSTISIAVFMMPIGRNMQANKIQVLIKLSYLPLFSYRLLRTLDRLIIFFISRVSSLWLEMFLIRY